MTADTSLAPSPCPFCRCTRIGIHRRKHARTTGYVAMCLGCGVSQTGVAYGTMAQACEVWNRRAQPLASRKPMFWVRLCSDDGYEGPIHDDSIEDVRKRSGAWSPLYLDPQPDEMSPDFTDTARAALLWVLWHHQGASSPVGQPIRFALGMGQHDRLNDHQLREAKRWEALHPVNPSVWAQGVRPLTTDQITALWVEHGLDECDPEGFARHIEAAHGITGATDGKPT